MGGVHFCSPNKAHTGGHSRHETISPQGVGVLESQLFIGESNGPGVFRNGIVPLVQENNEQQSGIIGSRLSACKGRRKRGTVRLTSCRHDWFRTPPRPKCWMARHDLKVLLFFFTDDARQISQYSFLTPFLSICARPQIHQRQCPGHVVPRSPGLPARRGRLLRQGTL